VLIQELYQTIGYVRSAMDAVRFKGIFLYGQACTINFLDQYLEKQLNIPTTCVNPMRKLTLADGISLSDPVEGAPFSLALGLAMRRVK